MSFSSDVKEDLSKLNNWNDKKSIEAEFFGYVLTGNTTTSKEKMEFITENEFNIERLYKILFNLNIEYEPNMKGKFYTAIIKNKSKIEEIEETKDSLNDEYKRVVVKGAFLGAGSVNNPNNQYHLEILFQDKINAEYVQNICDGFDIKMKILKNNKENKYHLYIKEGEEISKFLALIGANKAVLLFEDIRVLKDMKNNVNRLVNCETANLNKIVNASVNQVNDIRIIQKLNKFDDLPYELKEIATLRIENPDASLIELGKMLNIPIGKSGVNHRLKRINQIANDLKK